MKDIPVLGGAAQGVGAVAKSIGDANSAAGTAAHDAAAAAAAAASSKGGFFDWMQQFRLPGLLPGLGGGYGIGTLPSGSQPSTTQRYPVLVGGQPARSQGGGTPAPGGARPSVAHGPVTNHYNVTINTTSDQHAREVAKEAVRDLHRYGSLTPSGVELGFHGS